VFKTWLREEGQTAIELVTVKEFLLRAIDDEDVLNNDDLNNSRHKDLYHNSKNKLKDVLQKFFKRVKDEPIYGELERD
jgi:hypothetical protein